MKKLTYRRTTKTRSLGGQQIVMTISEAEEEVGIVVTCLEEEEEEVTQALVEAEEVLQFLVEEDFQHLNRISHIIIDKYFNYYSITVDNFMYILTKEFCKPRKKKEDKGMGGGYDGSK